MRYAADSGRRSASIRAAAGSALMAGDTASSGSPGIDSEHAAGDISAAIAKEILNGV